MAGGATCSTQAAVAAVLRVAGQRWQRWGAWDNGGSAGARAFMRAYQQLDGAVSSGKREDVVAVLGDVWAVALSQAECCVSALMAWTGT